MPGNFISLGFPTSLPGRAFTYPWRKPVQTSGERTEVDEWTKLVFDPHFREVRWQVPHSQNLFWQVPNNHSSMEVMEQRMSSDMMPRQNPFLQLAPHLLFTCTNVRRTCNAQSWASRTSVHISQVALKLSLFEALSEAGAFDGRWEVRCSSELHKKRGDQAMSKNFLGNLRTSYEARQTLVSI